MKTFFSLLACLFITQFAFAQIDNASPPPPPPPPMPAAEEVFKVVEDMPRFPGCEELAKKERHKCANKKMLEYIYSNMSYPQEAKDNGIEGIGVVQFVIEEDGTLSGVKVLRSLGYGTEEAMFEVMNKMIEDGIKWIPGKQRGTPVRVMFNLPIKFIM